MQLLIIILHLFDGPWCVDEKASENKLTYIVVCQATAQAPVYHALEVVFALLTVVPMLIFLSNYTSFGVNHFS